jgi:uncharacterized protein (DUF885 family)
MQKNIRRITGLIFLSLLGVTTGCRVQDPILETPAALPSVTSQLIPSPSHTPEQQRAQSITPTPPPTAPIAQQDVPIERIIASLQGLPLDAFLEESFKQLMLRDPELVTELGLADKFGVRNDQLNNLSEEYLLDTQNLQSAVLELLKSYPRESLSGEQQLSYDVYRWYLENQVQGHPYLYHNYPVHHFLTGYHFDLDFLFTNLHPLEDESDVQDYIARLSQVDDQVSQLLIGLEKREALQAIPPLEILDMTTQNMVVYLGAPVADIEYIEAQAIPVYAKLSEKISAIESIPEAKKEEYLDSARIEIAEGFIPAYVALISYLEGLKPAAPVEAGVQKLPDGEAYYAYLLAKETSTTLTAEEIHTLGLTEVERINAEMEEVFNQIGVGQSTGSSSRMSQAIDVCGYIDAATGSGKTQVVDTYQDILDEMENSLGEVFDHLPATRVVIVPREDFGGGGFYVGAPADNSRPGEFHAGVGGSRIPRFNIPTIAYHEAIPGHHFQIALAQEADLPTFRNQLAFNGYIEGWALYAERLAWEMGMYADDPCGNLGRLQLELLRAVRLVTDTGIHAKGWTREEARIYMRLTMGEGGWIHEVDRYIVWPAQSTGYMVGMLKILELRQRAEEALGEDFDIREFHNLVLGNGSMPLEILEAVVENYVQDSVEG